MRKSRLILCGAGCAAMLACGLLLLGALPQPVDVTASAQHVSASPSPQSVAADPQAGELFEDIAIESVSELSVQTGQTTYTFQCFDAEQVSVNGQRADSEVFRTLVDNILTMPVVTISPFTPASTATLTLILSANGTCYTILFYRDADPENPYVSIIADQSGTTHYHKTDRWRLGTLLLTCEGTRIQDEKGAETPFDMIQP